MADSSASSELRKRSQQESGGHIHQTIEREGKREGSWYNFGELNVTASSRTDQKLDREYGLVASPDHESRRRYRFNDRDYREVEPSRNSALPWVISERRSLHFDDLGRSYGVVREFPTSVLARRQISAGKYPLNRQTRVAFRFIYCNCIRKLRYNYDSIVSTCIHFRHYLHLIIAAVVLASFQLEALLIMSVLLTVDGRRYDTINRDVSKIIFSLNYLYLLEYIFY